MEIVRGRPANHNNLVRLLMGILVFGSIWGFLEATLGGYLHLILFPNKGAIMAGIGVAIMSSALAIYKKPSMLVGIGVVAASFKWLDAWFFGLPAVSIHIINPAMAIIFESLAFSLVTTLMMNRVTQNAYVGIGAGILAGIVSAVAWVYFAIYVMNAPAYARVVFTAPGFISNQGVIQAIFFGVFVPAGYLAGKKMATPFAALAEKTSLYYATSIVITLFCWIGGAFWIMQGFE